MTTKLPPLTPAQLYAYAEFCLSQSKFYARNDAIEEAITYMQVALAYVRAYVAGI